MKVTKVIHAFGISYLIGKTYHRIGLPSTDYGGGWCVYKFNGKYHRLNGIVANNWNLYLKNCLYGKIMHINSSKLVL